MARQHEQRKSAAAARMEQRRDMYAWIARRANGRRLEQCQRAIAHIDVQLAVIYGELEQDRRVRASATPWSRWWARSSKGRNA